jgi:hypothetical protein
MEETYKFTNLNNFITPLMKRLLVTTLFTFSSLAYSDEKQKLVDTYKSQYQAEDYEAGWPIYGNAAEQGHASTQPLKGSIYNEGLGVIKWE